MRVEMETPNQACQNAKRFSDFLFKVAKMIFTFTSHCIKRKSNQESLADDGGTHSSNLWTLLEGNFISADFPRGHPGSHISHPTKWISKEAPPRLWIPSPKSLYHLSYLYKQYIIYDIYNIQLPSSPIERQMSSLWKVSLNLGRMRTKMLAKFPVRYKFSLGYQTIFPVLYCIKP